MKKRRGFALAWVVLAFALTPSAPGSGDGSPFRSPDAETAVKPVPEVPAADPAKPADAASSPAVALSEPVQPTEGEAPVIREVATVIATGYTAGPESTGKTERHPQYGITFSGVKVRRDRVSIIAADPERFPIGSVLYVPGYGYGVVADTGSAIKGDKIDLYFETERQVYEQWGKKTVQVLLLKKGSGTLTEEEVVRLNREADQHGRLFGYEPQ